MADTATRRPLPAGAYTPPTAPATGTRRPVPTGFTPGGPAVGGGTPLQTPTSTPIVPATATSPGTLGDQDAMATITALLNQYGLGSLASWAWSEITAGASTAQVTLDMQSQPAFQQRFPGIAQRQAAGLPAISPADYVSYEDSLAQLTHQYGIPQGIWDTPAAIGQMIGNDTSISEVQARIQQGYAVVATAPPEVRASFAQMFGAAGDGALAAYVMDEKNSVPVLEQQVAAAQLQGTAAQSSVNINDNLAMKLAQSGVSVSQLQNAAGSVATQASLFNATPGEVSAPTQGQGVEAQLGTDAASAAVVAQAQSARQSAFRGGGGAESDQFGAEGIGIQQPH